MAKKRKLPKPTEADKNAGHIIATLGAVVLVAAFYIAAEPANGDNTIIDQRHQISGNDHSPPKP